MIRKGNYQCCIVFWRVYLPFVTIMNELTVTHVLYLIENVSAQSTGACGYCLSEKEFDNIYKLFENFSPLNILFYSLFFIIMI